MHITITIFLSVFLTITNGLSLAPDAGCPTDNSTSWFAYNNNCYAFFIRNVSWNEAQSVCSSKKANLISPDTDDYYSFWVPFVNKFSLTGQYYVGLRTYFSNSNFKWLTNDRLVPGDGPMYYLLI